MKLRKEPTYTTSSSEGLEEEAILAVTDKSKIVKLHFINNYKLFRTFLFIWPGIIIVGCDLFSAVNFAFCF